MNVPDDLKGFGESTLLGSFAPGEGLDPPVLQPPSLRANMFDACHVGVVLRSVLFVEAVVAVGAMFNTSQILQWLFHFSLLTGGVLPATLAWLIAGCALKRHLARLTPVLQWLSGILLGAVAGLYGCGMLYGMGLLEPAAWFASAAAGALLSAVLLAGLFWRARARTPAATAARLAELQSRIRPHFLFNTLNSAIALVRAEPAKAEAVLEDLSELFRHALADPAESVTLDQEIALAQRYLAIEQIRFGERLQVQWNLDPTVGEAKLPPLLLQPLVENAIRHGVEPSASGAQVKVSTERRGSVVVIKVTNSTPAGVGERGHGLALANVRDRLLLLHDVESRFQTVFRDGIFQVRLEIPRMKLNILVVDDEALARSRLRTLLGDCTAPEAVVAAEAGNAVQAMTALRHAHFDAVLLDIRMPGMDGVALAQAITALEQPPAVIFVTAHSEHAVQAFEVAATDYLTKPVRLERLQQALQKVGRLLQSRQAPRIDTPEEMLIIQDRGRTERVPLSEVLYLKAELKYITVRTASRSYILDGSLSELEDKYPQQFMRIHRNALIARRAVRALEKHFDPEEGEGWAVRLNGIDELLAVSRRQLSAVREAIAA